MKARTATIKTNKHVARWTLAKLGIACCGLKCPTCLNKTIWRNHESTYAWCMTCPYEFGIRPVKAYEPASTDAIGTPKLPPTLAIIRSHIPGISLQDALDLLRSLRPC